MFDVRFFVFVFFVGGGGGIMMFHILIKHKQGFADQGFKGSDRGQMLISAYAPSLQT